MPITLLFVFAVSAAPAGEPPPPLSELPEPDRIVDTEDGIPHVQALPSDDVERDPQDTDFILHEGQSGPGGAPLAIVATTLGATLPALLAAGGLIAATALGVVTITGTGAPVLALFAAVALGYLVVPLLVGAGSGAALLVAAIDDTAEDWASLGGLLAVLVAVGMAIAVTVALIATAVVAVAMGGGAILRPVDLHGCGSGCGPGPGPLPRDLSTSSGDGRADGARNFAVLTPVVMSAGGMVLGGAAGMGAYAALAGDGPLDPVWFPVATAVGSGAGLVAGASIGGALGGAAAVMSVE